MMKLQLHYSKLRILKERMLVLIAAILSLTSLALTRKGLEKAIETLQSQELSMHRGQGMLFITRNSKKNQVPRSLQPSIC
jgi:porphobilinogen deaminase